ncbi:MAG: SUMF1/EgtB/PvdO family nonheme iron enzyme [Candidatus Riflebacteria bacterium]|nr:SUMF1/EgtB/PvdO family nonheme iron enzyme [Candidatus Riflebacteria bacterium]
MSFSYSEAFFGIFGVHSKYSVCIHAAFQPWTFLYGWFKFNSNWESHPVGLKKPNGWGLYDLAGNVGEWEFHSITTGEGNKNSLYLGSSYDSEGINRWFDYGSTENNRRYNWIGFRVCRGANMDLTDMEYPDPYKTYRKSGK